MGRWLLVLVVLLAQLSVGGAVQAATPTGFAVLPLFQVFYERYGGVPTFGYALSGPVVEGGRLVQYFERQRFEYHPEHAGTEYEVLLGHLGRELAAREGRPTAAVGPKAGHRYFPETGHNLAPEFVGYWEQRGGLRLFGYPITEPFWEGGLLVQYTERARFEYHPDKAGTPWAVLLGRLGAVVWEEQRYRYTASETEEGLAAELLRRLNQARQQQGLGVLERDPVLDALALFRSSDMARQQYFSHTAPDGTTVFTYLPLLGIAWRAAGETLQRNNYPLSQAAAEAARSLLASPSHRVILLDGRYTHVGVACVTDRTGMHYFTVVVIQSP